MGINEIIMYIMMFFMLIAAVDRILSQFGGSARFLGKLGKSIEGSGGQFEEGFMAMGALGLAMVGMTALAPVLAHLLGPVIIPLYEMLGANPSMFAGTLLACDMGGFFLAKELAGGDVAAWMYSGLILGSMMGPTIVFSIPVALGIIEPTDRRWLALGVLAGIVTIPIGCIAGGLVAMYSGVEINGQPVAFTFALILMNMIPVIIVAVLVALGLKFIPEKMINGFQIFAKFLVALITIGLAAAVIKFLLGWELIPGLDPIFMAPGDQPGEVMRAIEVIGSISCVLLGAYPMVLLLTRWFEKPLMRVGNLLKNQQYGCRRHGRYPGEQYPDVRHDEADGYPRESDQLRLLGVSGVRPRRPSRFCGGQHERHDLSDDCRQTGRRRYRDWRGNAAGAKR